MRYLLLAVGWLSVALGALGIILPLLPTTPFLLLACGCFSKASPRFEYWLTHHRSLGPFINNWRQHRVIPRRAKMIASSMLLFSAVLLNYSPMPNMARYLTWLLLLGVFLFIISRRSQIPRDEEVG